MAPDALIHVHSAASQNPEAEAAERSIAVVNARLKAVALERTGVTPEQMDDFLGHRYDPVADTFRVATLTPAGAASLRWADGIADLDQARVLCAHLAGGGGFETPRTFMLRERALGEVQCMISGGKIMTGSLLAGSIAGGELKTTNYAEDVNGNPTAGAKLDHMGTALKVAPANFQIGSTLVRDAWFGRVRPALLDEFRYNAGAWTWVSAEPKTSTGEWSISYNATSNQLSITLLGWATKGFNGATLSGAIQSAAFAPPAPAYFITWLGSFVSGADLVCVLQLRRTTVTFNATTGEYEIGSAVADWRGAGVPRFNLAFTALTQTWWEW